MIRKLAWVVVLVILLAGCTAADGSVEERTPQELSITQESSSQEETEEGETQGDPLEPYRIDEETVRLEPSLIQIGEEIFYGPDYLDQDSITAGHLRNSYAITRSLRYLDHWYREFEAYYPMFTDEIPHEGADAIAAYYENLAQQAQESAEAYIQSQRDTDFSGTEIKDWASFVRHYQYQNYRVEFADPYLSVIYDYAEYTGGAHDLYSSQADNFDMRTGQLLAAGDVLQTGEEADELLSRLIEQFADPDAEFLTYQVHIDEHLPFYLTSQGVTFVFNPYENGSFAAGLRLVSVPYQELSPILALESPPQA